MNKLVCVVAICSIAFSFVLCQDDSANNDPSTQNVLIHFMDYKKAEFISQFQAGVKESIANRLSEFCRNKQNDCLRENEANYTVEDIGFYGAIEKERLVEDGRFVIVKLYAKQEENKYLNKDLLKRFVIENREHIVKEGKVAIAYVNKELVYPPRDNTDNYIIVSISCGFCVILVIFNIICLRRRENEIKNELLSKAKKSTIYNPDKSEKSESSGVKKRSSSSKNDFDTSVAANVNEEDYDVHRFPIPEQTPMLTTASRQPNIRHTTQV